ncbi:MAG: hypothetical protein JXA77_15815 [Bacteroidales bacterium]|nr:hypothetical protein [Bacteroidales bacterium]
MRILFPILAGSEFRQFFLSSVVTSLLDKGNQIFAISKFDDANLIKELQLIDNRIIILPHVIQPIDGTKFSYLRFLLDEVFDKHNERWRYSPKSKTSGFSSFLINIIITVLRIPLIHKLATALEQKWMIHLNVENVENLLFVNKIDKVVVSNARFLYYPELLIACAKLNIPVDVVYHSNKEIFAQPRINYNYNSYGMWNSEMLEKFTQNYSGLRNKCEIIGNSHFTYLLNEEKILSIDEFRKKFNVDDKCLVILYTAAGIIVKNEMLIVDWISDFIHSKGMKYKIIVRKNPMDTTSVWDDYFHGKSNIYIQTPQWVMDNENGINYTKQIDLIEFNSLLTYISFCVNLPSTVTLETALKKKPTINIAFEFPGVEVTTNNCKLSQFWHAPYYLAFHKFDFVLPAFNIEQLAEQLDKCISVDEIYSDYEKCAKELLGEQFYQIDTKIQEFILGRQYTS